MKEIIKSLEGIFQDISKATGEDYKAIARASLFLIRAVYSSEYLQNVFLSIAQKDPELKRVDEVFLEEIKEIDEIFMSLFNIAKQNNSEIKEMDDFVSALKSALKNRDGDKTKAIEDVLKLQLPRHKKETEDLKEISLLKVRDRSSKDSRDAKTYGKSKANQILAKFK